MVVRDRYFFCSAPKRKRRAAVGRSRTCRSTAGPLGVPPDMPSSGDRGLRPLTCAMEGVGRRTQICDVVGMIQLQVFFRRLGDRWVVGRDLSEALYMSEVLKGSSRAAHASDGSRRSAWRGPQCTCACRKSVHCAGPGTTGSASASSSSSRKRDGAEDAVVRDEVIPRVQWATASARTGTSDGTGRHALVKR